jgi:hypothetical protein
MGFVGFRCDRRFRVQPFFDTYGSVNGSDVVTVRAGRVSRRNFTTRLVRLDGKTFHEMTISPEPVIALPFAHYRLVTFVIHEGSEARILEARVSARFISGPAGHQGRTRLRACYVRHWSLSLDVS